ncbi:hypothetical protein HZS_4685, partial [Henneguya salminicola]
MVQCSDKIVKRHIDQLRIRDDNGKSYPEFHLASPIFTHVEEIPEQRSILQGGGQYDNNTTYDEDQSGDDGISDPTYPSTPSHFVRN